MNNSVNFIAEVSSNHNRNLKRCKKFIDIASDIGCYGIKFQLFKIEKLFHSKILKKSKKHRDRKKWELPTEFIPILSKYSRKKGLKFGCTPFYLEAVKFLKPYVDFYKIASYELLWKKLFLECIKTNKHIIFSTGMADKNEIKKILELLKKNRFKKISILRCSSIYPTTHLDANLKSIYSLKKLIANYFPKNLIKVGWSDHSSSPAVMYRAIHRFDSKIIEFHLDIDKKGKEFNQGHCWLPHEIKKIINLVNQGIMSDGDGKLQPRKKEFEERKWRTDPIDGLRPLSIIRKKVL